MAHLGHSGAPRGNEASFSEEMCQNHCSVVQKQGSRNSAADPADPADPAEMGTAAQNRPWVPHAGGQDDGSLNKLPQTIFLCLKLNTAIRDHIK